MATRKAPRRRRRVTILDVAAAAGVAASTVSRSFSRPDRISAETREHVIKVAGRLGYRPRVVVGDQVLGQPGTLALILGGVNSPYTFDIIQGATRAAAQVGYLLVIADSEASPETERQHFVRLTSTVNGCIVGSSTLPDPELQALIHGHRVVTINRPLRGVSSVLIDPRIGMRQAAEHFASFGHQQVAYLGGSSGVSWSDKAEWQALKAAGSQLGLTISRVGDYPTNFEGGAAAADAVLAAGVTAVVAFNDTLAIGVLRRLADRGVTVPDQISVMGVDDIFGADFCHPTLTTIRADTQRAGRAAVELLYDLLTSAEPRRPRRLAIGSELIIRDSTGATLGGTTSKTTT